MVDPNSMTVLGVLGSVGVSAGNKIVSPAADRIGQFLYRAVDLATTYGEENIRRIFEKWEARRDRPISDDDLRRVLPILPLAAKQSDDDLQARWAALLEHTATSADGSLPGFAQTLSELTPEEAKFLDRFYAALLERPAYGASGEYLGARPFDHETLITIFDSSIDMRMMQSELLLSRGITPSTEQKLNSAKVERAKLVINDLERHGMIQQYQITQPERWYPIPHLVANYEVAPELSGKMIPIRDHVPDLRSYYGLSEYGLGFIRVVSPKKLS